MTYRTNEGEILDIRNEEARGFLAKHYPAIMAERPIGMSDEYQFMPSYKIAENLIDRFGLGLVSVGQQFSRSRDPRGQEHFMRFRMPTSTALTKVGDSLPELVIMNSHNGRSTLRAYAGVFRLVCSNGMVVAEKDFGKITLRHFGHENNFDAFSKVLDQISGNFKLLDQRMGAMEELRLTPHQQNMLARALMKARGTPDWVEPDMILRGRRPVEVADDNGMRSLWKTYNVLQESLAEAHDIQLDRAGARARSLRPLSGARSQILVNNALWGAMSDFASAHWPELFGELVEGTATEVADPETTAVVAEDHAPEEAGQETTILRRFDEVMALDYEGLATVSDEELKAMDANQRKKFSSRKSYLKKKANA